MSQVLDLPHPYLLFLGDTTEKGYAKTAFGLRDWARDRCVGEWSCAGATVTRICAIDAEGGTRARARWSSASPIRAASSAIIDTLARSAQSGVDLIHSGMHAAGNVPQLKRPRSHGRRLIDVRTPPKNIPIATAPRQQAPADRRHRCAVGKYTALSLARAFAERGVKSDFRATGQTGDLDCRRRDCRWTRWLRISRRARLRS